MLKHNAIGFFLVKKVQKLNKFILYYIKKEKINTLTKTNNYFVKVTLRKTINVNFRNLCFHLNNNLLPKHLTHCN